MINATFRSGTNQFRGAAWEFNRNTKLNATGFFKPSSGVKPTLNRNQFGGVFGGPDRPRPRLLLRQLRGLPPGAADGDVREHPDAGPAAGHPGQAGPQPDHRRGLRRRRRSGSRRSPPFAKTGARRAARRRRARARRTTSTSLPRRQDFNDKFDVKFDQKFNAATTAFFRFSHRKANNFEPPPIPGETSSPANDYVEVLNQQYARRRHARRCRRARCSKSASACRGPRRASRRSAPARPNMLEAYGITGLPTDTVLRRRSHAAVGERLDGVGPAEQQSAVPESARLDPRLNYSWIRGRHTLKTGYEYQRINTDVDDVHPKYGADTYAGQFSRPTGAAADAAMYNLADFLFGARSTYELVNPFVFNLRQRMHFGYLQDDWKVSPNLTVNMGVRYEFGTPQWEEDNHLTNFDPATNTLLQATRRLDLRPRAGQPRSQQLRAARRRRLQHHAEDGDPVGVRHQLHPLQPAGRREPALVQRPARRPDRDHPAAVAGRCARRTRRRPPASARREQGYPEGLNVPANFNPLNGRVNHIPPDNEHRQRAELARDGPARTADEPAGGRRVHRQPQPQPDHPRRLESGAAEQRRREPVAAGAPADSGIPVHPDGVRRRRGELSTRCRSRWSGAIRAACTC